MQISYELHSLVKGRWNIERTYKAHQKETALEDAKILNREQHISAVKLICETYNPQTNSSTEVVIFDTDRPVREPAAPAAPAKPAPPPPAKSAGPSPSRRKPAAKKKAPSMAGTVALAVILIVAVAVLAVVLGRGRDFMSGL